MQALATLGIHAYLHEIDSAVYLKRLDNFEYDMTTYIYLPVTIPGAELTRRFGSAAASQPGSENYPGVKSKAVDALIHAALAGLGVSDRFEVVRSAEREAHGKPHPAVFLRAAERLGVDAIDCVVFEDSLNGLVAAKAARMRCIAVPEHHDARFALADAVLPSLEALDAPLLRTLGR